MLSSIVVDKVGKRFGDHRALAGVELELRAGSVCALLGANGAGKTTLLGILSTLVRASAGTVAYLDGATPRAVDDALRADIGLLAHASLCYGELTAIENLRFFAALYGVVDADRRAEVLLDEVGLEASARTRAVRTYSRGMVQRLALARALLARPSLLLLDEPFTGLDRDGAMALGTRLGQAKAEGAIVVCVTHDLEAIAGVTDHVAILRRGKLAFDERDPDGYSYAALRDHYHGHAS
ncbi:MAG: ABC transporter ATP-binding protein [Myxococcales bacterium]|nr:ABC transporter ATP-binding protein [Myxococcales bacterium]